MCIRKRKTVSYIQCVYVPDFVCQKEGNCIAPTVCLLFRFCASESVKLYHTYSIVMFYMLCIRKMEAVSYQQIERNFIISRMCVCSDNFGRKIRALVCLFELCEKDEIVSHQQYIYVLDFVYQKKGNRIKPTVCLWSRFCISERVKLYHTYIMFIL